MPSLRIKICGITKPDQGRAIAELGATALGFICVHQSPRYVLPTQIRAIVEALPDQTGVDRVGVFADAPFPEIAEVVAIAHLNVVQLHGNESPQFCQQLRNQLPEIELIKAFRVRTAATLAQVSSYVTAVDTLLLDAYHPTQLGGTGQTLDWSALQDFHSPQPWFLAGGIHPQNVIEALSHQPDGVDLSSGVERSPGDKDLDKVAHLFEQLSGWV